MQNLLDYEKTFGLLWGQVYQIMQGSSSEIAAFIQENDPDAYGQSALQAQNEYNDNLFNAGKWATYRDDMTNVYDDGYIKIKDEQSTIYDAVMGQNSSDWKILDQAMTDLYGDAWTKVSGSYRGTFDTEMARSSDITEATKALRTKFDDDRNKVVNTVYQQNNETYHYVIKTYADGHTSTTNEKHSGDPCSKCGYAKPKPVVTTTGGGGGGGSSAPATCSNCATNCGGACYNACQKNCASTCATVNQKKARGCFIPGTLVQMANGLYKPIETIYAGDMIMAYNVASDIFEPAEVVHSYYYENVPAVMAVLLSNSTILGITPSHPILTTEGWKSRDIEASKIEHGVDVKWLNLGDRALTREGSAMIIGIFDLPEEYCRRVYNLEVDKLHTFTAETIIVHNAMMRAEAATKATGGTISKPTITMMGEAGEEYVFNAADTRTLKDMLLTDRFNSIMSLLASYGETYSKLGNTAAASIVSNDSSTTIEKVNFSMNVSKIANDYDAQRAGEQALNKMLEIARKTSANNSIGR